MNNAYCAVCHHHVYNMAVHLRSEEHKRHLRAISSGGLKAPSKPTKYHSSKRRYGSHLTKEEEQ